MICIHTVFSPYGLSSNNFSPTIQFSKAKNFRANAIYKMFTFKNTKPYRKNNAKKTEENNRMGKTRDLIKKIRDTQGIFHEKMGTIKDRKGMDPTEAEDIKKRWQEYTEEL